MTEAQRNALASAVAALHCLAEFAKGKNPYPERADAVWDAEYQAQRLREVFPQAFDGSIPE